ncbi:MAG: hypothetical protein KC897_10715 [Candidatus Omnitrophica bacterium]|nr:hypothetical protein [Candidatus Omnitrophota bacterium]MCB9720307.1 hypothetical protein [Candidatus Omnitrophota bacterium]
MRKIILGLVPALMLTAAPAAAEQIVAVNLDDAGTLATLIETDTKIKTEGDGSIRITAAWPVTVPLHDASGLNLDNVKLVYKAQVRSKDLVGKAYLEMWVRVKGQAYFSRGTTSFIEGTNKKWQTIVTPFILQPGQVADQVMLNIIVNGKGTVWVDDIVLEGDPLIPTPK